MKHTSIKMDTPLEFINITPVNPLISKCQIKVCYVSDKPNRNGSIITKEVAADMAKSLPGSPIVGYFNEYTEDFEEHNRIIDVSNGKFEIKDTTRPYGFVDLNAKVWFQKFLDDGMHEREYLMTEGWLWTGQYPECQRALALGNNQSMELDDETLKGSWSKDDKGFCEFFIINEAVVSKLCILGEEFEPCFEGANIGAPVIQFSLSDGFKEQILSMMNELKEYLNKGGEKVATRYSVEIGDALWTALYDHVADTYSIESVCEDGEGKYAVLNADDKYYRLDFSFADDGSVTFAAEVTPLEDYTSADEPQFAAEDVAAYAASREEKEDVCPKCGKPVSKCECKGEEVCPECGKPLSECECDKKKGKKDKYNLEEIQEYIELSEKYSSLETQYNEALTTINSLNDQLEELIKYKASIEKTEKQKMIDDFYMLSDEDKKDVIDHIDTYSLEDIEAKLSIICVRNKVNFSANDEKAPTVYSLHGDENVPAWVKAVRSVANEM